MDGKLKDDGIKALLDGLAVNNLGLCIVTTRYSIPDLRVHRQGTAPQVDLLRLSKEAGAPRRVCRVTGFHALRQGGANTPSRVKSRGVSA